MFFNFDVRAIWRSVLATLCIKWTNVKVTWLSNALPLGVQGLLVDTTVYFESALHASWMHTCGSSDTVRTIDQNPRWRTQRPPFRCSLHVDIADSLFYHQNLHVGVHKY